MNVGRRAVGEDGGDKDIPRSSHLLIGLSVVGAGRGASVGALALGAAGRVGVGVAFGMGMGIVIFVPCGSWLFELDPSFDEEASFIAALAFDSNPIPSEGGGKALSSPSSVQSENLLG
jgi:hypothetical protein